MRRLFEKNRHLTDKEEIENALKLGEYIKKGYPRDPCTLLPSEVQTLEADGVDFGAVEGFEQNGGMGTGQSHLQHARNEETSRCYTMTSRSQLKTPTLQELLTKDYVNEDHIAAFAHALKEDEAYFEQHGDPSSPAGTPPLQHTPRIRKISALSDFAPINLRVKRRGRKKVKDPGRRDILFTVLRWPLLAFISIFIMAQFSLYIIIRQVVNTKEWITAWRGKKGALRKRLRAARTYEEWKEAAKALDNYMHFDEWKRVDEDPYYDWKLVKKVKHSLKTLREKSDARGCLGVLETCIRANFAAIESSRLYSETYLGTKDLIESYFDELEKSLEFIRNTPDLSIDEKRRFFKSANTNLGVSALCLSGGASFGYYHFGVVKAFFDAGLLPRVITGTSAGGLIAAMMCCYTDEELKIMLVPELANRITACEESIGVWIKRFWKTGARFDSVTWARKCSFFTHGSLTFKEAYLRTGRVLNISVIPADRHSPTKLLNYITAPDTVIWSTLLASAAVPGILNPVVIMQKLHDGTIVPWNWGSRFKDGSLRVDIPVQALNLYFNVTHPVVSQVNPHVHLFFFAPRGSAGKPVAHSKGKGWRGNFLLSAAEQWLKHELTKNFKVIRDLELLPQLLGQDWSSVFLQRFDGAVTIWPRTRFMDWIHILDDPNPEELDRMMKVGQLAAWPKVVVPILLQLVNVPHVAPQLHMIENRMRIEKQIYSGRQEVRKAMKGGKNKPRSLLLPPQSIDTANSMESNVSQSTQGVSDRPERPLSLDTDAENAFSHGSRWFYRRGRRSPSPAQESSDPLLSPSIRRKWASGLLDVPTTSHQRSGHLEEQGDDRDIREASPSQGSFFARLRQNSIASLSLPFSHSKKGSITEHSCREASSIESSSDDTESVWPQEYLNHASLRGSTQDGDVKGQEVLNRVGQESSSEDI
ncbi:hypothetical protein NMY22_g2683 [Coprinellus aureogranulatus]|nr:hypothetical protein NMY22_g2683 [Coprinellus aureogranulatus]